MKITNTAPRLSPARRLPHPSSMQALTGATTAPHFLARCLSPAIGVALVLGCLCGVRDARAQVEMEIRFSRHSYILYEPVIATVEITNVAGRDLEFEDVPGKQWFNVEITTLDGDLLPPTNPDYKLRPLTVPAGQTVSRKIDLTPLFPIREMGQQRVRANVYLAETKHFYYSNTAAFEMTDGKLYWRQSVGVPGSTDTRQLSLLTNQLPDKLLLYVRIRDEVGNTVYTTQSLGKMILGGRDPEEMLDRENNLHVLQEAQPGGFLYTEVGLDGSRLAQKAYVKVGPSHPFLAKTPSGDVVVRGGQIQVAPALAAGGPPAAAPQHKLSDRPAGLPATPKDPYAQ